MRSKIIAGVAAAIGFACASPEKAKVSQATAAQANDSKPRNGGSAVASSEHMKDGKKVICTFEETIGTHIREKVCRYQEDIDSERADTLDMLRRYKAQLPRGN